MNKYIVLFLGLSLGLLAGDAFAEPWGAPNACSSNPSLQSAFSLESPKAFFEEESGTECAEPGESAFSNELFYSNAYQNPKQIQSYRYSSPDSPTASKPGVRVKPLLAQMLMFTTIEQATRMASKKTRLQIKGPFLRDWFDSVNGLGGWSDGGKFFTNYVAHPMQGSTAAFIYKNNDTRYNAMIFSPSDSRYWKMTGLAMVFAAVHSLQFEIGPYSESSLGNVGIERGLGYSKMAMVDIVITPTIGTAFFLGEDALDKHLIQRIERGTQNSSIRAVARIFFNPTRSLSNILRFKSPAYRDDRQ